MSRFSKSITIMILLITFQSSVVASGKEYYENLVSNWSKIFLIKIEMLQDQSFLSLLLIKI